jgi:predicted nucleotidyltransferase
MKTLESSNLTSIQREALNMLREKLFHEFDIERIILYGSAARGEATADSDIDVLIVTTNPKSRWQQHQITDVVFEVNLQYDTTFSSLIVDRNEWKNGYSFLLLQDEIANEGVEV